jgi:hypothetical protein
MMEREKMLVFMKELSDALISVRPLGGSELFVKRFDDYFADPAYCKAAIQVNHERYHEAMKENVRLRKALLKITEACEADCGVPSEDDEDDEPVGASADGPMALTFGMLRRARAAIHPSAHPRNDRGGTNV